MRYPKWQKPYEEALLEIDGERFAERSQAAEKVIVSRMAGMRTTIDSCLEAMALENALRGLLELKEERAHAGQSKIGT